MNISSLISNAIRHATVEVFNTMLNSDVTTLGVGTEPAAAEPLDGVVAFIGLAGPWVGTGSITCSPSIACRICSQMLLTESTSVTEEVLDAVAEMTNMIIGNVKTDLERHLGPMGLSIPTVVFGRNFKTKSAGNAEVIVERFRWCEDEFVVKVCLAQSAKQSHARAQVLDQSDPNKETPAATQ